MPLRSILAAYAGDAQGSSGLRFAIGLARRHAARLTGIVWHGPTPLETRYRRFMTKEIHEVLAARDQALVADMRADFDGRVAAEGLADRAAFIDLKGRSDFSLATCARGFDLTVFGSRAIEVGREHFAARPDVVALRSGRPVVLVPQAFDAQSLGERAVFAWDGKRAAARALGDALHILGHRGPVTVLSVERRQTEAPDDGIMALLAAHGIEAEHVIQPEGPGGVAQTLLDACAARQAGLLIMGAYEHSKFAEDLLGGVTRDIMDRASVPVLMAH
jgi:nucleotide-binding universal stress UspA family protein